MGCAVGFVVFVMLALLAWCAILVLSGN